MMRSMRYERIEGEGNVEHNDSNGGILKNITLHSVLNSIAIAILIVVIALEYHELNTLNAQYRHDTSAMKGCYFVIYVYSIIRR